MRLASVSRDPVVLASLVALLGVLVHLPVLGNDFVFDDTPAIVENPLVVGDSPATDVFITNFWGGRVGYEHTTTWRPLTTLSFRATWSLFGGSPRAFHASNLLLHFGCVMLVFAVAWRVFRRDRVAALVASALFAVLPVHVEAVAAAVNRAELLCALFYLAGLWAFLRGLDVSGTRTGQSSWRAAPWYAGSLGLFLLAVLSKEHALTWPFAVAVLWAHRWGRHRIAPTYCPAPPRAPGWLLAGAVVLIGAYLAARAQVLPAIAGGDIPPSDNPMVDQGLSGRLLTAGKVYFHYLRLLVAPLRLSPDYSAHAIPVAHGLSDADAFAGLALMIGSFGALWTAIRRSADAAVCLGLFVVLYGLISNVVFLSSIILAERLLYLPSVAWCLLVGLAAAGAARMAHEPWLRGTLVAVLVVILSGYAVRSADQATRWRDARTLFQSAVDAFPDSVRARVNLAVALLDRGLVEGAEEHAVEAQRIDPSSADALETLADVRLEQRRPADALALYERAFAARPRRALLPRICAALVNLGRYAQAAGPCSAAAEHFEEDGKVRHMLGVVLLRTGRPEDAARVLREAERLDPSNPGVRALLDALPGPGVESEP